MGNKKFVYAFGLIVAVVLSVNYYVSSSNSAQKLELGIMTEEINLKPCDCPDGYTSIVEVSDPDASTYDLCSCTKVTGFNPTGSCKGEC